MRGMKEITLGSMNQGSAEELFAAELKKVLENIDDPSTKATEPRKITMEISFIPTEDRETGVIKIESKTKLAPIKAVGSTFALDSGKVWEHDFYQPPLINDNVAKIDQKAKASGEKED